MNKRSWKLKQAALNVLLVMLFLTCVGSCAFSITVSNADQILTQFVEQLSSAEK